MNKTQSIKVIRPALGANGKISAKSMVKALLDSGCPATGTKLIEQLTDAERVELGIA